MLSLYWGSGDDKMTKMKEKNKDFNNQHLILALRQKSSANKHLGLKTWQYSISDIKVGFPIPQIVSFRIIAHNLLNLILILRHQLKAFSTIYPKDVPGKLVDWSVCSLIHYLLKLFSSQHILLPAFILFQSYMHVPSWVAVICA